MGAVSTNPEVEITTSRGKDPHPSCNSVKAAANGPKLVRKNKKKVPGEVGRGQTSSSVAQSSSRNRGIRLVNKRRNARFMGQQRTGDVEAIAFPLGMSIAAVAAQVLEKVDASSNTISADHLSMICTSAVRESLANVFGDRFEPFARNFEKSFVSTLSTLRLIKNSSVEKVQHHPLPNVGSTMASTMCADKEELSSMTFYDHDGDTEAIFPTIVSEDQFSSVEEIQETKTELASPSLSQDQLSSIEEIQGSQKTSSMIQELSVHGEMSRELACGSSQMISYSGNGSMFTTIEKSVMEQARANDLKTVEIGLTIKKLRLKETQLALASESNFFERCKLSMGISLASFKTEKFKNQLEETRHAELLTKCIDCLVAGLLIMSGCIFYGAYVYSYKRISDATSSCTPSMESKPWWVLRSVAGFNSGLQTLRCQLQVLSRMLFGIFMILIMAYLLIQRSVGPRRTMPITFILLLLGVGCGFAGKFCIDTLGGSGSHWLMFWEMLCSVHLFANIFTSGLFYVLYGPIKVSQGTADNVILFPYWMRRVIFYFALLVFIPILSGLIPFASPVEWKDHVSSLIWNMLLDEENVF